MRGAEIEADLCSPGQNTIFDPENEIVFLLIGIYSVEKLLFLRNVYLPHFIATPSAFRGFSEAPALLRTTIIFNFILIKSSMHFQNT